MVGGVFAGLAADAGFRVAVLDEGDPPQPSPGAEWGARVVALSRASEQALAQIGAWPRLDATRVQPYRRMCVWDAAGTAFDADALTFDCADIGEPNLGFIVENDAVTRAIHAALAARGHVDWQAGVRVEGVSVGERQARVQLADGQALSATLVVAADGAHSVCRELMGIAVREGDYGQRAIVSHVASRDGHGETAWQRFLPGGPLALLPLADGRSSIVWSAREDEARALEALDDDAFCRRLTEASGGAVGDVTASTPRRSFALRWLHAERYVCPRFALIGDAAHVVHPLAGLGVNLGLQDAVALAQVLSEARERGRDPGDRPILRRYARWRKAENAAMQAALGALNELFGIDRFGVSLLRRLGMRAVNRAAPLKRRLARRALGIS